VHAFNPVRVPERSQVTWNPSFTSVVKYSFMCATTEEHILPSSTPTTGRVVLPDVRRIHWDCADKTTGKPLAA